MVKKERRLSLTPALRPNSPRALDISFPRQTSSWTREDPVNDEKVITKSVYTQTSELLSKYAGGKKKSATIFCLDKVISVGVVESRCSVKSTLQCIAMAEGLFSVSDVKVVDQTRQIAYLVQEACEIFVVKNKE